MKMIKYLSLTFTIWLLLLPVVFAQSADAQQIERDIRIAEGILAEMLQTDNRSEHFPGFNDRSVNGRYIPGYGVHFIISPGSRYRFQVHSGSGRQNVQVESDQTGLNNSEENIKNTIREYFKTYASTIRNVPENEWIRVSYGLNRSGFPDGVHLFIDGDERPKPTVFTMWVSSSDLNQFRNGNLSDQQFTSRIQTQDLSDLSSRTDLNVFASVLETALNDSESDYLRVRQKPNVVYLPGLGVQYHVSISGGPGMFFGDVHIFDENFEIKMDSLMIDLSGAMEKLNERMAPLAIKMDSLFGGNLSQEERDSLRSEARDIRREIRVQADSMRRNSPPPPRPSMVRDSVDVSAEKEKIVNQLLEIMESYGRTLTSLDDDELLMVNLNWSGAGRNFPQRTEVRIKKSDLLRGSDPDIEEFSRR